MVVLSNNPLLKEKDGLPQGPRLDFHVVDLPGILTIARNRVHQGYRLLSHPLSGSVKPNHTPYKSILLSDEAGQGVCLSSLSLIENARAVLNALPPRPMEPTAEVLSDYQAIDRSLILSALESGLGH